ncbi:MAG: beta-ketoacyl synthase [Bacteroidales bacterium]|nr:beta-ketoacyl synthase [Bacteroidales bacterium]
MKFLTNKKPLLWLNNLPQNSKNKSKIIRVSGLIFLNFSKMVEIFSDNIISPLGFTTKENYDNVKLSKSGLKVKENLFGLDGRFCVAEIENEVLNSEFETFFHKNAADYTILEKMVLLSVGKAIFDTDVTNSKTAFYFSSTKGDLQNNLWYTAKKISEFFGNKNTPVVVSNACVSGLCAVIAAARAINSGRIDTAVVTGADVLSKFTVSGFSSLKALSSKPCRPFDIERNGLNLGEAASTIVLKKSDKENFICGSIRNDAYHISSPSKTAEGAFFALNDVLKNIDKNDIAFISAHGTATFFNDEMEANAIFRAGLSDIPVSGLKGCYGHTLGAAGLIETVLSFRALNEGEVLKTHGYETSGVSKKVNIATENLKTDKKYFIKLISGFGGVNAAAVFKKN